MMYFIDISYNGKNYHGWQIQKNAVTVQSTIQDVISKILGKSTDIVGSGRTDTGVHAKSQVAHFDVNKEVDNYFIHRVNAFLPQDISINSVTQVIDNSHARFDAISREYIYKIHDFKSPFLDGLSIFYNKKIPCAPKAGLVHHKAWRALCNPCADAFCSALCGRFS